MRTVPTAGSPPYIFLDVDGVLNNLSSVLAYGGAGSSVRPWRLDEVCVQLVRHLASRFEAHVVVSSSWRGGGPAKFASMMALYNWPDCPVVGEIRLRTKKEHKMENYKTRGDLIRDWLKENAPSALERGAYLIIDDEEFAAHGHPDSCFVQTSFDTGFRQPHFQKATKLLK